MGKRKVEAWARRQKLVAEQGRSGLSVAAFCRERKLCAPYFFAWKKRLNQAGAERFVPVRIVDAGGAVSAGRQAIELRLSRGCSLMVEPGFDAADLLVLVTTLETRS